MASGTKKREWFHLGAQAYSRKCPAEFQEPTYPCPICLTPFTIDALTDNRLSSEHVPPKSVGGKELLLTCTNCNNTAGTLLDASAKTKEDVQLAMSGRLGRPQRIKAAIGDLRVNGELHTAGGTYSLQIPRKINKPGTSDLLKNVARQGTPLTLQHQPFSELGAKISWLRSGYLALFAAFGYDFALDPAMEIVRRQIVECDERKMVTFTSEIPQELPLTVRRIFRVVEPEWDLGWAVQFGRYFVRYPQLGDMTFYERLVSHGGVEPVVNHTTYMYLGWPTTPNFGLVPWPA